MGYLGFGSYLGMATEVAWGGYTAPTNWLRLISSTLGTQMEYDYRPHLGTHAAVSRNHRSEDQYLKRHTVGGDLEVELGYGDSSLFLLYHALGACTEGGGGGPVYVHDVLNAEALPEGMSLDLTRGDGTRDKYEGCLVDTVTISGAVGEGVKMKLGLIGETCPARAAHANPTYGTTDSPLLHHHCSGVQFGGAAAVDFMSWEITLSRGLQRRFLLGNAAGSYLTYKPVRGDFETCKVKIVREYDADTAYALHIAGTSADLQFTYTEPVGVWYERFIVHNATLNKHSVAPSGAGPMTETLEFDGLAGAAAAAPGIEVVVENGKALITTN
jgi:hypothetical protein